MKKLRITLNGQSYDVTVEEIKDGSVQAAPKTETVKKVVEQVKVAEPVKEKPNVAIKAAEGEVSIVSPMPGKVLDVKCSVGQSVKAGELLFILEAMKMENEIVAPRDGVVSAIAVNKGANVGTDDLLATVK